MYTSCHVCRRDLGRNEVLQHLSVGRRIAFDPARGRLWVVCPACGEWNLTPIETRWEAVEECERRFPTASDRVSTKTIGLARIDTSLELVRIGAALRNDLANWRYASRLQRRHRRTVLQVGAVGLVGAGAVSALSMASLPVTGALWLGVLPTYWAAYLMTPSAQRLVTQAVDADSAPVALRRGHFANLEVRRGGRRQELQLQLRGLGREIRFGAAEIGPVLTAGMPHVNWLGASPNDLAQASRVVEDAEAQVTERQGDRATVGDAVWFYLLDAALADRNRELRAWPPAQRFALEMALTEAAEELALTEDVKALEPQHSVAAEVAAIADELTWTQALTAQFAALKTRLQR